jgi:hypothetical protein
MTVDKITLSKKQSPRGAFVRDLLSKSAKTDYYNVPVIKEAFEKLRLEYKTKVKTTANSMTNGRFDEKKFKGWKAAINEMYVALSALDKGETKNAFVYARRAAKLADKAHNSPPEQTYLGKLENAIANARVN